MSTNGEDDDVKLRGLLWWVDKWLQSSAYRTMTVEEQGAYRNLIDAAFLLGGALPNNERILANACGDATRWPAVRDTVMRWWVLREDGWHNETLDKGIHEARRRAINQRHHRARLKAVR